MTAVMDIEFNCNHCGQHIVIDAAGAGSAVQCPKCQAELVVPQAQPAPSKPTASTNTHSAIPKPTTPTSVPPILPSTANKGALHNAVMTGDQSAVEQLVANGVSVNTRDERSATPLHYARIPAMAEWLLANGAAVNAKDSQGRTPVFNALDKGVDKHVIELLLASGAQCNVRSNGGATPLHRAALCDQSELEKVELLLAKGADVNAKDNKGRTPAALALAQGRHDVVKLLRNYQGIDAILAQANTLTLHDAVMQDDKIMVALLITKGADVNATDDNGRTPLDVALAHHKSELAEILTAKGAKTTTAKDRFSTQILRAMTIDDHAAIQRLISEGANLNDALFWALTLRKGEMIKLFLERGAVPISGCDPLHDAVAIGDTAAVQKLIAEGADVNKDNGQGMTPLDWAQVLGKEDMAKLLILVGAAKAEWLNAREVGSDGADEEGEIENRTDRYIPDDVKDAVWRRDEGRCVKCKSNERLEFDHIIPVSKGGSNTKRNVQLLCEKCNREKGAEIA